MRFILHCSDDRSGRGLQCHRRQISARRLAVSFFLSSLLLLCIHFVFKSLACHLKLRWHGNHLKTLQLGAHCHRCTLSACLASEYNTIATHILTIHHSLRIGADFWGQTEISVATVLQANSSDLQFAGSPLKSFASCLYWNALCISVSAWWFSCRRLCDGKLQEDHFHHSCNTPFGVSAWIVVYGALQLFIIQVSTLILLNL